MRQVAGALFEKIAGTVFAPGWGMLSEGSWAVCWCAREYFEESRPTDWGVFSGTRDSIRGSSPFAEVGFEGPNGGGQSCLRASYRGA